MKSEKRLIQMFLLSSVACCWHLLKHRQVNMVMSTYGEVQKIHLFEPHPVNRLVAGFVFYKTPEARCKAEPAYIPATYRCRFWGL
eukprot:4793617-Amphidinium_carterae.1